MRTNYNQSYKKVSLNNNITLIVNNNKKEMSAGLSYNSYDKGGLCYAACQEAFEW